MGSENRREPGAEEMYPDVDTGLPTASGSTGGEPTSSSSPWTARQIELKKRQIELRKWLESNAPTLAPVYSAAVQMVHDPSFPGRVWLVAHAVREIRNRLPDAIAGELRGTRTEYSQLAEEVRATWVDDGLPSDGSVPVLLAVDPDSSGPERYDISWSLLAAVGELVVGHLAVADRKRETARRLFEATTEWPIPAYVVESWLRSTKWANAFAHVRNQPLNPSDEESLAGKFDRFENALTAIARRSYENMDELDEILDSANR
jgi:hypothetical protein